MNGMSTPKWVLTVVAVGCFAVGLILTVVDRELIGVPALGWVAGGLMAYAGRDLAP